MELDINMLGTTCQLWPLNTGRSPPSSKGPEQKRSIWHKSPANISKQQLVGGIPTPLKNMKVSWDDSFQYMEK